MRRDGCEEGWRRGWKGEGGKVAGEGRVDVVVVGEGLVVMMMINLSLV